MKTRFFSLTLLVLFSCSLSSCFVSRDPHGRSSDRGSSFPHDEHKQDPGH
ncbi:hypothetical protein [Mucilaginibacter agri]|uniref:Lipoprotein n=1 Tax=Mucilaginibacter agri TaxID=2695265 RepID=A0A965ZGE6_9SPHI|nr:hypothetical protein [Mucilaginibacter agri]NCD70578.1 hypothetical protein [Mucilaginibacter agri]